MRTWVWISRIHTNPDVVAPICNLRIYTNPDVVSPICNLRIHTSPNVVATICNISVSTARWEVETADSLGPTSLEQAIHSKQELPCQGKVNLTCDHCPLTFMGATQQACNHTEKHENAHRSGTQRFKKYAWQKTSCQKNTKEKTCYWGCRSVEEQKSPIKLSFCHTMVSLIHISKLFKLLPPIYSKGLETTWSYSGRANPLHLY